MKTKFFRCKHCGNVIMKTVDSGVEVVCCGEPMEELMAHTTDTGVEKHLPVVVHSTGCGLIVRVGSVEHPMTPHHYIQFIYLETERGGQIVWLMPTDKPAVEFCGCKDKPKAVYEYCNIHGLWKTEISE